MALIFVISCWFIWKWRNTVVFEGKLDRFVDANTVILAFTKSSVLAYTHLGPLVSTGVYGECVWLGWGPQSFG